MVNNGAQVVYMYHVLYFSHVLVYLNKKVVIIHYVHFGGYYSLIIKWSLLFPLNLVIVHAQ